MLYVIFSLYLKDISYYNGVCSIQIIHSLSMEGIFYFLCGEFSLLSIFH